MEVLNKWGNPSLKGRSPALCWAWQLSSRKTVLILRIDGEDLKEFVESTQFEPEAISIFSQLDHADTSLHKCLTMALGQLSVDHGMPPSSDPRVILRMQSIFISTMFVQLDWWFYFLLKSFHSHDLSIFDVVSISNLIVFICADRFVATL